MKLSERYEWDLGCIGILDDVVELEADVTKLENEVIRLEDEVDALEKKNESLMKLAGMYIKSYEDLVFGDAEYEDYEIGKEEVDDETE